MGKTNVVFAADDGYVQHLAVALKSLLENNSTLEFKIYVLSNKLNAKRFHKLLNVAKQFNCKLENITLEDSVFENLELGHHFTRANYYRLLIPQFIDEEKVLYLDADIVVNGCIKNLYSQELKGTYLAAVPDPGFDRHESLQMKPNSAYFNSGVMLINNKKWKEENLGERVISFVAENRKVIKWADQDGLNAVVNGSWLRLDLTFNQQAKIFESDFLFMNKCFSNDELDRAKKEPIIVHYTGSSKPWQFGNKHPFRKLYWDHLSATPFRFALPEGVMKGFVRGVLPNGIKRAIKRFL